MICPHCNARWQEEMNMTRLATCPFCNKSLIQTLGTIMIKDFSLALSSIAAENGTDFLLDKPAATLATLADCTSSLERERKMLQRFYECKIHELFREVSRVPDYLMNKAVRLLSEESLMSREICEYIVTEFIKALGLEVILSEEEAGASKKENVSAKTSATQKSVSQNAEVKSQAVVPKAGTVTKPEAVLQGAMEKSENTASTAKFEKISKKIPIEDRGIAPDAKRGNDENMEEILAEWNGKVDEIQVERNETRAQKLLKEKLPSIVKGQKFKLRFGSEISETELMHFEKAFKTKFNNKSNIFAIIYNNLLVGHKIMFTDTMIYTLYWQPIGGNRTEQIRYDNITDVKVFMLAGVKEIKILDKKKKVLIPGISSKDFDVDAMTSLLKQLAGI